MHRPTTYMQLADFNPSSPAIDAIDVFSACWCLKMPKYKLLLGAALGKVWEESDVLDPLPLQPAAAAQYRKYREDMVRERQMDPLRVRMHPGHVMAGAISSYA